MTIDSKYLEFNKIGWTGKTHVVNIHSKRNVFLGTIRWHGPWRQYCFLPTAETVFNIGCMEDINKYIKELMAERRQDGAIISPTAKI